MFASFKPKYRKLCVVTLSVSLVSCAATQPILSDVDAFIEKGGVVIVELESIDISGTQWELREDAAASGGRSIEWTGEDLFSQPGEGLLEVNVQINTPGSYLFTWANKIGFGEKATEANDSWLKIQADKFYAVKGSSIVCPKGQDSNANSCVGELPEGAGKGGWFKAYRSGGPIDAYKWSTFTSDRDPHSIYADFSQVGVYTIQISGRSKHNIIDRLMLVREGEDIIAARELPESLKVGSGGE